MKEWSLGNQIYDVPFYQVHRVHLWGATAMILAEAKDLILLLK